MVFEILYGFFKIIISGTDRKGFLKEMSDAVSGIETDKVHVLPFISELGQRIIDAEHQPFDRI